MSARRSRLSFFGFRVARFAALILPAVLLLAPGCSAPSRSLEGGGATARVIETDEAERVFGAARGLLMREFGRVEVDRGAMRMTTSPTEYNSATDSGTARGAVGLPSRMRRTAIFVLRPQGERLVARLRIDIEREDAQRRSAIRPAGDSRFGDSPAYTTAIDEDAATQSRQNVAWTPVRRDTALERTLLEELQAQFVIEPEASVAEEATSMPTGE